MNWWAANTALLIITKSQPSPNHCISNFDVSGPRVPAQKDALLCSVALQSVNQASQIQNPDARFSNDEHIGRGLLERYADGLVGVQTADYALFGRCFWELPRITEEWGFQQSTTVTTLAYGGREHIILWEDFKGELARRHAANLAYVRGRNAWGKLGVAVSSMGKLPVTLYTGELFDNNVAVILPKEVSYLPAIWAFCQSSEFNMAVRRIDTALKVTNATLVKVPFDLERWQQVANKAGPLPEPYSNDPTQWLFKGCPADSTEPLQVAVARLLGYRWPQQEHDRLNDYTDADGIVCLPPIAGEQPAEERLRALLAAAYSNAWSTEERDRLLASAGSAGKSLDEWLRDGFFKQHCALFHNRPFIWHIWDGRKDGFSALVNYHKLDAARLNKLIYTYLGTWIQTQKAEDAAGVPGANDRLVKAIELQKKLETIRDGEPPNDIYVRWKPLHQQPIGWHPDMNDGVRLNIRPFVTAGVLRSRFSIHWNKDRGTNPDGSERLNDRHYTNEEKRRAREEQK